MKIWTKLRRFIDLPRRNFGYDVVAVLAFSSAPLIIGLSNGGSNPVLAGVLITIGQLTMFLFLIKFHLKRYDKHIIRGMISFLRLNWHKHGYYYSRSKHDLNKEGLDLGLFKNIWNNYAFIGVIPAGFFWLMFAWSIKFLDIATASIIVGLYLIIGTILLNLDRYNPAGHERNLFAYGGQRVDDRNWGNLVGSTWGLLILFMIGIIVTLSHANINLASDYRGLLILIVCITSGVVGLERSSKWTMEMYIKWQRMYELYHLDKERIEDSLKEQIEEQEDTFKTPGSMFKIIEATEEATVRRGSRFSATSKQRSISMIFGLVGIIIGLILSLILITLGSVFWIFQGNTLDLSFASSSIDLFTNKIVITNRIAWIICIIGGFITAIGVWSFSYYEWTYSKITVGWNEGIRVDLWDILNTPSGRAMGAPDEDQRQVHSYRLFIYCLTPVLSLVWLFPFGLVQLQRRDYLLLGTLIILATSILIPLTISTFHEETRTMLKWLIISLCSIGILIYFREEWIQWPWLADDTPWEWSIGSVDYYSLIVLTATMFILILSFRYNRLVARTNSEEDQFHRINTIIDKLSISLCNTANVNYLRNTSIIRSDLPDPSKYPITSNLALLREELNRLDKNDLSYSHYYKRLISNLQNSIRMKASNETTSAYVSREKLITEGVGKEKLSDLEIKDLERLSDLKLEFDLLFRSKQRGKYVAENLVLYIFSLITVFITISTRPAITSNWNAFIIDLLAFLFSAAVCFMTMNLADLKLYREKSTAAIEGSEHDSNDTRGWLLRPVQVISIILTAIISISFVVLLYDKWMGIWFL